MFCIAAFIVFAVLAIFSASYRPLAAKAWHCVIRRVTFRPCDISFGEEMKGKLIGKLVFSHPRLAKVLDRWIDWISFAFVALSIWSLLYVANAGLNLWVYDTCDPGNGESCSLSGEACSVDTQPLTFIKAIEDGRTGEWVIGPFTRFVETMSRIPDRLRTWQPAEYVSPTATYARPYDAAKPVALEIIDPGCRFCKKLTHNLEDAGAFDRANVSYLLYPIPLPDGGTKFPNSMLVASYIEAAKHMPIASRPGAAGDWELLHAIFADAGKDETDLQTRINIGLTRAQTEELLRSLLAEIGYTKSDIAQIAEASASAAVKAALLTQKQIVEERVRTIKIPTLLLKGRRFDRVITPERISQLL